MSSHSIYHNFIIKAPQKGVFDAVSQPQHLDNWWPLKSSGEPKLGTTYNLNFTDAYDWYGEVVVCEPNNSFHIKMTKSDKDWDPTTFGFDLQEHDQGTYVRFSHVNWPEMNDHLKFSSFCWGMLLNGLKDYLEKGTIIPFENRN
ncbi:SRPBCC domain-containing protein [Mangrovimonas sp. ST2L15]|uniref:SRPBCC family protein n=1 Tax=Mangrovimonas sp. ST2L15 TaxID=1645916 RepID=UPI0006B55CA1|nr:SRPBCC domain-containing protein [Mangrovimonas sp. ST2L15]